MSNIVNQVNKSCGIDHRQWTIAKYGSYSNYCEWIAKNKQDGIDAENQVVELINEWLNKLTQLQKQQLDKTLHSHGVIINHSKPTRHKIADIIMGILRADVKLRRCTVTLKDVTYNWIPKVIDAALKIIITPIKPTFKADARDALQAHHIRVMTPGEFIQYLTSLITSQMLSLHDYLRGMRLGFVDELTLMVDHMSVLTRIHRLFMVIFTTVWGVLPMDNTLLPAAARSQLHGDGCLGVRLKILKVHIRRQATFHTIRMATSFNP